MRRLATYRETVTTTNIVTTSTSTPFKVSRAKTLSVQAIVDVNTPSAEDFLAGEAETGTITFDTKANTSSGDYIVLYDAAGLAWGAFADLTGADAQPTGAVWTAISSSDRKVRATISGDTTAAEVAATFVAAFESLTGFTDAFSLTDNEDGTVDYVLDARGPATDAAVKNTDDSGAGSIAVSVTNQGVASTVDVTDNEITITSHGFTTGLKGQLTTTGTLPTGVSTATDYFVISVDDNTIKLASSLANALAGTAIDLTDQGTDGATHTFTATSIAGASLTLQKSNNYDPVTGTGDFDAVETATSITVDGHIWISDIDPEYEWARLSYTLTAGRLSATSYILVKEDV